VLSAEETGEEVVEYGPQLLIGANVGKVGYQSASEWYSCSENRGQQEQHYHIQRTHHASLAASLITTVSQKPLPDTGGFFRPKPLGSPT
jgi:hypothetical protein